MLAAFRHTIASFQDTADELVGTNIFPEGTGKTLEEYYKISESYPSLIENLVAQTETFSGEKPSEELRDAWKRYFGNAIAKGTDVTELPKPLAALKIEDIEKAMNKLPDKKAPLWRSIFPTSLTDRDRYEFRMLGEKHGEERLWNNLFGHKDGVILPLQQNAKSFFDDVNTLIEKHNETARRMFYETQARDNPERPLAGRTIQEQLIRLNPGDPSRLQVYRPNKASTIPSWEPQESAWMEGPKLNNYLQTYHPFEWNLIDRAQLETEAKGTSISADGKAPLRTLTLEEVAHQSRISADEYDPDCFRILISRDPQKIGEIANQRDYTTCLAKDGPEHEDLKNNIKAETFVVYLVQKQDIKGRWPIMRMLVKRYSDDPYQMNESREDILVQSKIYGGDGAGNARTRQAMQAVTSSFIAPQNEGKYGIFSLKAGLYNDGLLPEVTLQKEWTPKTIRAAVRNFQKVLLTQYLLDVQQFQGMLERGEKDPYGGDLAYKVKTLKKDIRRILSAEDMKQGLPRMYYREMCNLAIRNLPPPEKIVSAVTHDKWLTAQGRASKALLDGDLDKWNSCTKKFSSDQRLMLSSAFIMSSEKDSSKSLIASMKAFVNEVNAIPDNSDIASPVQLKGATPANYLRELLSQMVEKLDHRSFCEDLTKVAARVHRDLCNKCPELSSPQHARLLFDYGERGSRGLPEVLHEDYEALIAKRPELKMADDYDPWESEPDIPVTRGPVSNGPAKPSVS